MKSVTALTIFLASCLTVAQTSDLADGLRQLDDARTTLDEKSLLATKDYFANLTQKDPANATYLYQLARTDAYLIECYATHNDQKKAEAALDDATAAVAKSISLNDHSADAHSLLADLYGRKISLGIGFMAGARFGPKSDAENKKALALDPNNARVQASLGRQYLHAPKMFGGDVDKAIASFQKATQLDPKSDENFVWLAVACRKKGDTAAADKALAEALRLNPRSAFAKATAGR